jgi:hypothetical protein
LGLRGLARTRRTIDRIFTRIDVLVTLATPSCRAAITGAPAIETTFTGRPLAQCKSRRLHHNLLIMNVRVAAAV